MTTGRINQVTILNSLSRKREQAELVLANEISEEIS